MNDVLFFFEDIVADLDEGDEAKGGLTGEPLGLSEGEGEPGRRKLKYRLCLPGVTGGDGKGPVAPSLVFEESELDELEEDEEEFCVLISSLTLSSAGFSFAFTGTDFASGADSAEGLTSPLGAFS